MAEQGSPVLQYTPILPLSATAQPLV